LRKTWNALPIAHKPRTILITGCSTGIGRAAAVRLAARGHRVVATARNLESIKDLARDGLKITACDVTDEASMDAAVAFTRAAFGPIEGLVNNAGYGLTGPVETVPSDEARRQFEVNVFGAMRLAQLVLPDMRRAGWGRIVNISSIGGRISLPLAGWYSASKFALEALSDALRFEVDPFGVSVVSILPGPVRTEFLRNMDIVTLPPAMPRRYALLLERLHAHQASRLFEISADDVARVITRAMETRRPRPRYLLTLPAKVGIRLRPFFTDRGWNRLVTLIYGIHTPGEHRAEG
jgi:NAD(P)-dependent dehydrogenase (short-subunit alcohol dehydrogenase family)